jgi:hypothetical protein
VRYEYTEVVAGQPFDETLARHAREGWRVVLQLSHDPMFGNRHFLMERKAKRQFPSLRNWALEIASLVGVVLAVLVVWVARYA